MNIVFRADASIEIGTGHIMRCLTLAEALAAQGARCRFICREFEGNLIDVIRSKGFAVDVLPVMEPAPCPPCEQERPLAHATWLGATQDEDAASCISLLDVLKLDWLVVDHYGIDARWERQLRPYCSRVLVIDDLADRAHDCDLLLDQNLGRAVADYQLWVPSGCRLLIGPGSALLRPEFAQWRDYSLARRENERLQKILISMGGVDKQNATGKILAALADAPECLPGDAILIIVMGRHAPHLDVVRERARTLPWSVHVLTEVSNMAEIMANSDLAIGAAGGSSWERCCLGLPTLQVVIAENQRLAGETLVALGATANLGPPECLAVGLPEALVTLDAAQLRVMSDTCQHLYDGHGTEATVAAMLLVGEGVPS